jgi:hypothetical protein
MSRMTLDSLEEVDEGDYGTVLVVPVAADEAPSIMYYDDDDVFCASTDVADCKNHSHPEIGGRCECGEEGCCHYTDSSAICYPVWDILTGTCVSYSHGELRAWPESAPALDVERVPGMEGWLYAVALCPELSLGRVKIGYTKNLDQRLRTYRTPNPTSMLVGCWPANPVDEQNALIGAAKAGGVRLAGSEVFDFRDLWVGLTALDERLRRDTR